MQPYYDHAGIQIYHGDCLDVMASLPPASIDAVITDPPYGTTACAWDSPIPFAPMWAALKRLIKPRAPVVLFGSQPFTSALVMSNPGMFRYSWVWDKVNLFTNHMNAEKMPMRQHEDVMVFADGLATFNRQFRQGKPYTGRGTGNIEVYGVAPRDAGNLSGLANPSTILPIPAIATGNRGLHPTQKPLALMAYFVKTYTDPGATVLDFTAGSGTTLRAAKNLGRRAIGIELEERYCDIAARRLSQEVMALDI